MLGSSLFLCLLLVDPSWCQAWYADTPCSSRARVSGVRCLQSNHSIWVLGHRCPVCGGCFGVGDAGLCVFPEELKSGPLGLIAVTWTLCVCGDRKQHRSWDDRAQWGFWPRGQDEAVACMAMMAQCPALATGAVEEGQQLSSGAWTQGGGGQAKCFLCLPLQLSLVSELCRVSSTLLCSRAFPEPFSSDL